MTENNQTKNTQPQPNPDLKRLDRLIGTWQLSEETRGTVSYAWMEGGFFLMQQFDIELHGHRVKGIEIIGHLQPFGEAPSAEIKSRIYDNTGNTFDYVYELTDDTLMIWGGEQGSPAYYEGNFSADGNACSGAWTYPGGGGYRSTMTRVK